jgi:hypothetical protein
MVYYYGKRIYKEAYNCNNSDYGAGDNSLTGRQYGQHAVPLITREAVGQSVDTIIRASSLCGRALQYRLNDLVRWKCRIWYENLHEEEPDIAWGLQIQLPDGNIQYQKSAEQLNGGFTMHGLIGNNANKPQNGYNIVGTDTAFQFQAQDMGVGVQLQMSLAFTGFMVMPRLNAGSPGLTPTWYVVQALPGAGGNPYCIPVAVPAGNVTEQAWTELRMEYDPVAMATLYYINNVLVDTVFDNALYTPLYNVDVSNTLLTKYHAVYRATTEPNATYDVKAFIDYDVIKLRKNDIGPIPQQQQ